VIKKLISVINAVKYLTSGYATWFTAVNQPFYSRRLNQCWCEIFRPSVLWHC